MKPLLVMLATALVACGGKVGGADEPRDPVPPTRNVAGPVMATPTIGDDAASPPSSFAPPSTPNAGNTIALTPTKVAAERYAGGCGIVHPPFIDGDVYSMDIISSMAHAPSDGLSVSFMSPVPVGTPLALAVQPFSTMETTVESPDGGALSYAGQDALGSGDIDVNYSQGSGPTHIDPNAFDSVVMTILAMPAQDGDPLTIRLQIHFVDGQILDDTFSSPLVSVISSSCPAG